MGNTFAADDRSERTLSAAIEDVAFLVRADHRVTALVAMADAPQSRSSLQVETGMSSSTISRTIRAFENKNWIERAGHAYETTPLGSFVATSVQELLERIETEQKLRCIWNWLPTDVCDIELRALSEAVVTVATTAEPYGPVNRFVSLLDGADEFRFLGSDIALFEPCRDELRDEILGGMRAEVIDPPEMADYIFSTYPDYCDELFESGNLTVMVNDDVPEYGLVLLDDHVGICGYDSTSGAARVMIDTDSAEILAWAESTYESYRRESRPFGELPVQ